MIKRWYHYVEGVKVYWHGEPIQIGDTRIAHPTEEQLLEAGYEYEEIDPHPEPTLDELKQQKIMEIDQYDSSDAVNQFYINDQGLWIGPDDRSNYRFTLQDAIDLGVPSFTFLGYTINPAMGIAVLKQVNIYAATCVEVTSQHKMNVMSLETKEEVEAYDYTVGYPEKLHFTVEQQEEEVLSE